jgi:myosin heavy subunit
MSSSMFSSEETGYDTTGSIIRNSRVASRRELLKHKRTRTTDILPPLEQKEGRTRTPRAPQLREENLHLRRELESLQESMNLLGDEIEAIHRAHQQEIEQYQQHLRDMMDERNQMQEANQQWERRYQDLYHSFQDAVEEEASKMVQEAAQTLVLSPEHTPALLGDVVKTLEAQLKQSEDQQTAELLAVMRQTRYKAERLEQEITRERNELAIERENLRHWQESMVQQARQRFALERARLRGRWTAGLTLVSILLFSLMVVLELIFYSLHTALTLTLFGPLAICMVLSYIFAHMHTRGRIRVLVKAQRPPAAAGKAQKARAAAK